MKKISRYLWPLVFVLYFTQTAQADDYYKVLRTETNQVYYKVRVREVTPRSLIVFHSKGMGQILLKDLPKELQKKYGYSPLRESIHLEAVEEKNTKAKQRASIIKQRISKPSEKNEARSTSHRSGKTERILKQLGNPPEIKQSVDLRPKFIELKLGSKDQGRRPSCSVFAVVSALEYQNAILMGRPERLSEEYLIWATRKTLGLDPTLITDENLEEFEDAGFALLEVVQALGSYGIPRQQSMPNTFGKSMTDITEPSATVIDEAKNRKKVHSYILPGYNNTARISAMIHALNQELPVVIGMAWPHSATLRNSPVLSKQNPVNGYAHAVTVVGYTSENGQLESTKFLFKNSWGRAWGINGYGWITYEYMNEHLNSAVFLDITN